MKEIEIFTDTVPIKSGKLYRSSDWIFEFIETNRSSKQTEYILSIVDKSRFHYDGKVYYEIGD